MQTMTNFPTQLDEINQWLADNFGILPGACSSTENLRYNTARMVAEALWKRDQVEGPSRDQVDKLKEAAEDYAKDETMAGLAERAFKDGAKWQREQDESRKRTNVTLANTYHPKDKQVEIAFEDIWLDAEVSVEAFGAVDANLTNSMKSLCHDFFEAGTDWQKEQLRDLCYQCEKNGETIYYKGMKHAVEQMKKGAIEARVFESSNPVSEKGTNYHTISLLYDETPNMPHIICGDKVKFYIFKHNKK